MCRDSGLSVFDFKGLAWCHCMTQSIYITKQHSEGQSTCTFCPGGFVFVHRAKTGSYGASKPHKVINQPVLSININNSLVQTSD